jgi:hypothetical protein
VFAEKCLSIHVQYRILAFFPCGGIFKTSFASVYPLYLQKAERKGKTKAEVDAIIFWLTGYSERTLQEQIDRNTDFETFFADAPRMNPHASEITGLLCGHLILSVHDYSCKYIRLHRLYLVAASSILTRRGDYTYPPCRLSIGDGNG